MIDVGVASGHMNRDPVGGPLDQAIPLAPTLAPAVPLWKGLPLPVSHTRRRLSRK